jgi:hypothetical protein
MFALSSLLRRRLDAQRAFVELHGDATLQEILSDRALDKGLRVKVVTLLYDLLFDEVRSPPSPHVPGGGGGPPRRPAGAGAGGGAKEHHRFEFSGEIKELQLLAPLVPSTALGKKGIHARLCEGVSDLLLEEDGNTAEKTMETIVLMSSICKDTLSQKPTQDRLHHWWSKWCVWSGLARHLHKHTLTQTRNAQG